MEYYDFDYQLCQLKRMYNIGDGWMSVEHWLVILTEKTQSTERRTRPIATLSTTKSNMDWHGIKPGPPRRQAVILDQFLYSDQWLKNRWIIQPEGICQQ
jgi:hypothetical protein